MKALIILLVLTALAGCDTEHGHSGTIIIDLQCSLPPDWCAMDDARFADTYGALSEAEQNALVIEQVEPRTGFVSVAAVSRIYDTYVPLPTQAPSMIYWSE